MGDFEHIIKTYKLPLPDGFYGFKALEPILEVFHSVNKPEIKLPGEKSVPFKSLLAGASH